MQHKRLAKWYYLTKKSKKLKIYIFFPCLFITLFATAQKVDSIYFHLYTDSLKKGVHNYINVDGKLLNGRYLPLSDKELTFWSNAGVWKGNDLIIDSSYKNDSINIKATLKSDPKQSISIILYIKKSLYEGELRSENDLFNNNKGKKRNN